jgi:hypothetical protein
MSSQQSLKKDDINLNIGRHNILSGISSAPVNQQGSIVSGAQPLATTTAQTVATGTTAAQTTVLISNEPHTVVSHDQRLAANMPVITERHIQKEYIPVIHEEIVTQVPIVTGQSVTTGQAIAGERFVQPMGVEYLKQQSATKVDLIPQVETALGAQEIVHMNVNQQAQYVGKATVIPSQQIGLAQTTQTVTTQQLPAQTQFVTQQIPAQNLTSQAFSQQLQGQQVNQAQCSTCPSNQQQQVLSTPLNQGSQTAANINLGANLQHKKF